MTEICFNAYDNRNGTSWTISRMVGEYLVPWLKIHPFRMEQHQITDPISYTFTVHEWISTAWSEIYRGTHDEDMSIAVDASKVALRIVFSNGNMNQGTADIECCYDTVDKCNLNVSIYDEEHNGVENATVTYAGQTKDTTPTGFVSFLVSCDTVADVSIALPVGYSRAGESRLVFKDTPADADNDPTTPHILYVEVMHSPPVPEGVMLNVPSIVMAGSDIKITGTCDIPGLPVDIYAVKKLIGFDWLASDTLIATAITGADRRFETTVSLEEFGILEMYAKVTDDLKSSKHTVFVLTWTMLIVLIIIAALVYDKSSGGKLKKMLKR